MILSSLRNVYIPFPCLAAFGEAAEAFFGEAAEACSCAAGKYTNQDNAKEINPLKFAAIITFDFKDINALKFVAAIITFELG